MAAEVAGDDDDAWLYGDNTAEDQRKEEINAIFDRATEDVVVPGEENVITTNGDIQVIMNFESIYHYFDIKIIRTLLQFDIMFKERQIFSTFFIH